MNHLAQLEKKSVHLVLNDPPYGTTANAWDNVLDWQAYWELLLRAASPNATFVFFSAFPMAADIVQSNRGMFRYDLIWEKTMPVGFLNARRAPLRKHEILLFFSRGKMAYRPILTPGTPYSKTASKVASSNYGKKTGDGTSRSSGLRFPASILRYGRDTLRRKLGHPTSKPVALLKWILASYSRPGDIVLDPTMGGGSTGEACLRMQREFIGIEKNAAYFEMACARLGQGSPKCVRDSLCNV